ncbi:hypothetical protein [Actinophytocola sp.]|uniref:WXG100-like domain-containing protein n=1 Tax=Actinophytocola sp. TaxID=1872138 RepID=UPI002ED4A2C7
MSAPQLEAADRLAAGVSGGSWIAPGLRTGVSGAVDGKPVQRLAAAGLGDLVPLVQPLQQAVDRMVVDGSVAAFADAWQRAADTVEQAGQQLVRSARADEADWNGAAADQYRERARTTAAALAGAARVFAAKSAATRMMGEAVGSARTQANDLLDRLVDDLISYVQLASSAAGGMTAEVLGEATRLVESYAQPVAGIEEQLRQTAKQLAGAPGLGPAAGILAAVRETLAFAPAPGLAALPRPDVAGGDPNLILAGFDGSTSAAAAGFETVADRTPEGGHTRGLATADAGGGFVLAQNGRAGTGGRADRARELAEKKLGIRLEDWDPKKGFEHNKEIVKKVYEYYAGLYADKPQLQWAGMAKLAGVVVYAGFQDMQSTAAGTYLWLRGIDGTERAQFETKFLEMHQAVFMDLAYPHEVYRQEGLAGIERLNRGGELPPGMIDSWRKIDSGDAAQIAAGNKELLLREQSRVLQPYYDTISKMSDGATFTSETSKNTTSPIPGGQPFSEHGGNVANLKDRWDWIEKDMLPKYQELLKNPQEANRLIGEPLEQAAKRFQLPWFVP